ncbi:MAG: histidine phosphatase family protein [Oscillospiraceae bacterium]|jgi:alpha-ribazole phosphatase|nr:histidine phosphatase family protein [Oscillospiraceae bacterium]
MEVILIRHGQTAGNLARRYIGATDEPLCHDGIVTSAKSGIFLNVPLVYASPATRAVQTSQIKFPNARTLLFPGLREMDFGVFERRTADEMADDMRYRAWVNGECFGECPNGEGRIGFTARTCITFSEIVAENLDRRRRYVIIVAHAGTIMAIMERFARPRQAYFDWHPTYCGGYQAHIDDGTWGITPRLTDYREI